MRLLVSGEGPSDLGACNNAQGQCSGSDFSTGPMVIWLQRLWEPLLGYDLNGIPEAVVFVSKTFLCQEAKRAPGRLQPLRGKHREVETGLYYSNARQLGLMATALQAKEGDSVMAVLFRDADGTRSAPGQMWQTKWQSILDGFKAADFAGGVPMLPKPKSEVWLLCCTQQSQHACEALENISGNDDSPRSAKSQLKQVLQGCDSAAELATWCKDHPADWQQLCTMPSFKAFFDQFHAVAESILRPKATSRAPNA